MPRCRVEHEFEPWKAYQYGERQNGTLGYIELSEKELKKKQREYTKLKKSKPGFKKWDLIGTGLWMHWERKCKRCGKKDMDITSPVDIPKNRKVKVAKSRSGKMEKEKRYARKLAQINEKKVSKGWVND